MPGTQDSPSDASKPLECFQPSKLTFIDHKLGHADLRRMDAWPVHTFTTWEDFQEGQVLLLDKPREWTSFDVVNKLRWALRNRLGVKKFKVGHAGTLDPLATGVLVICTGRATKAIEGLQSCLLYTSPSPRD